MSESSAVYLLEIDAWTGVGIQTLRLATRTIATGPSDTPANTLYLGRIIDAGKFSGSISLSGNASESFGAIILNNQDGELDDWFDYGFDGREFRLKELLQAGNPVSSAALLFRGSCSGIDGSDAAKTLRIKIRDRLADLDVPLLTSRYLGTTEGDATAEGSTTVADKIKPRIYGQVRSVAPVRVNDAYLVDQWSDRAVTSITVYDGGAPLTKAANYPSLGTLIAAAIPAGSYATCLARGLSRLGAPAALKITGDVLEGSPAQRSAARVAQLMLSDAGFGNIDTASFDALHAASPGAIGILISDAGTVATNVAEALASIGAQLITTMAGQLRVVRIADPTTGVPVDLIAQRDIAAGASFMLGAGLENSDDALPAWSVVLGYGRLWQTLSAGEVLPSLPDVVKTDLEQEYRQVSAQDASVRTAHPRAIEITSDTLFDGRADTQSEAARRLALAKVRRDSFSVPLIDIRRGRREIGEVVTLRLDRFGLRGGKPFMIVGRAHDFQKRVVTLTVWG